MNSAHSSVVLATLTLLLHACAFGAPKPAAPSGKSTEGVTATDPQCNAFAAALIPFIEAKFPDREKPEELDTLVQWLNSTELPEADVAFPNAAPPVHRDIVKAALASFGYTGEYELQAQWAPVGDKAILDITFIGDTWSMALRVSDHVVDSSTGTATIVHWAIVRWLDSKLESTTFFLGCTDQYAGGRANIGQKKSGKPDDISILLSATMARAWIGGSIDALASLPHLNVVTFGDLIETSAEGLTAIGTLPQLVGITFWQSVTAGPYDLPTRNRELKALFDLDRVRALRLNETDQFDLTKAAARNFTMESLESLNMSLCSGRKVNEELASIAQVFPKLESLDLSFIGTFKFGGGFSDPGLANLVDHWPTHLQSLSVNDNPEVTSAGLKLLLNDNVVATVKQNGRGLLLTLSASQADAATLAALKVVYNVNLVN